MKQTKYTMRIDGKTLKGKETEIPKELFEELVIHYEKEVAKNRVICNGAGEITIRQSIDIRTEEREYEQYVQTIHTVRDTEMQITLCRYTCRPGFVFE